ncbi:MAG: transcriptional regulator [Alphaproteobacteria bacterium]|nr:transcriptional regulator [Alphaproteobacteria bacterium]
MARKTPKPGCKVRGSSTGRPIMAALDLAGRRWLLRVLWELRAEALTFRVLRERCGVISPTVLNTRLAEMRDAGLLDSTEAGYRLTARGGELIEALVPLTRWAERWAKENGK